MIPDGQRMADRGAHSRPSRGGGLVRARVRARTPPVTTAELVHDIRQLERAD
jgi:hypothetical protein